MENQPGRPKVLLCGGIGGIWAGADRDTNTSLNLGSLPLQREGGTNSSGRKERRKGGKDRGGKEGWKEGQKEGQEGSRGRRQAERVGDSPAAATPIPPQGTVKFAPQQCSHAPWSCLGCQLLPVGKQETKVGNSRLRRECLNMGLFGAFYF